MTSVSTTTVTDPSSVNTESAGVEDAESSQGGKPTQLESGNDLTAEEEALLARGLLWKLSLLVQRALWPAGRVSGGYPLLVCRLYLNPGEPRAAAHVRVGK